MAENNSGKEKTPDSSKSISETDSKKEIKKVEKSKEKKSPKNKKSPKKDSKSHSKKKEKKHKKKNRRSHETPAHKSAPSSPPESPAESGGEFLAPCSEREWEDGQAAYSASLLNVKRKLNRPSVFSVPDKAKKADDKNAKPSTSPKQPSDGAPANGLRSLSPSRIKLKKKSKSSKTMDRADQIGKIVAGIVRKYLDGKNEDNIQVEIKLVAHDGTHTPVVP